MVAAESKNPPDLGLYIGAFTLESVGLAPLLMATVGFLQVVSVFFSSCFFCSVTKPRF
jgi:hypothetical protein